LKILAFRCYNLGRCTPRRSDTCPGTNAGHAAVGRPLVAAVTSWGFADLPGSAIAVAEGAHIYHRKPLLNGVGRGSPPIVDLRRSLSVAGIFAETE